MKPVEKSDYQPEITATQYVILAENQRKKRALIEAKAQYTQLLEENKQLLNEREQSTKENYEVTEYLRNQLQERNEIIANLEKQLEEVKDQKEEQSQELETKLASQEATLRMEAEQQQQAIQDQVDSMTQQLEDLEEFQKRKDEVEGELAQVRERNNELKTDMEKSEKEWEQKYVEMSAALKREYEQRLEELKKRCEEDIDDRLDAAVRRILEHNRRMAEELQLHVQESEQLHKEVAILEEARERLVREVEIKVDLEHQLSRRCANQSRSIKDVKSQLTVVEGSMQQLVQKFEHDKLRLQKAFTARATELAQEIAALRRLLKLKCRETSQIRHLAHEVLLQRSTVESFLISSLDYVSRQAQKEAQKRQFKLEKINDENSVNKKFSEQSKSLDKQVNAIKLHDQLVTNQIDISQLSWPEKEQVIQLLYTQIQNQASYNYYKKLQPQSVKTIDNKVGELEGLDIAQGAVLAQGPTKIV